MNGDKFLASEDQLTLILDEVVRVVLDQIKQRHNTGDRFAQGEAMAYWHVLDVVEGAADAVGFDLNGLAPAGRRVREQLGVPLGSGQWDTGHRHDHSPYPLS